MEAREYQNKAIVKIRHLIRKGVRRILVYAPTGAGKTIVFALAAISALQKGRRLLFVAHRRQLIYQAWEKLTTWGVPERDMGVIMAGDKRVNPNAQLFIASIQTLSRRNLPEGIDIVAVDECHAGGTSPSYMNLQKAMSGAVHLGFSATPFLSDGRGLNAAYDEIVIVATPAELMAQGFLSEPGAFTIPRKDLPDLKRVKIASNGDYENTSLTAELDRVGLVGNIVGHWKRHAGDRRTVVFCASVAHSQEITRRFVDAGIGAAHIDGHTPQSERERVLGALERGEIKVISNCGVLCEGWDQPSCKCAVLARPTRSEGLYLQMAGRILRPWEGVKPLILDHAGAILEFGMPQSEREITLQGVKKKKREKDKEDKPVSIRVCEQCFAMSEGTRNTCWACEAPFPTLAHKIDEEVGELVEVSAITEDGKRAAWNEIVKECRTRGYNPGWCSWKFKDAFGHWPPRSWSRSIAKKADDYTEKEKNEYWSRLLEKYGHNMASKIYNSKFGIRTYA